jgi:hypothetical protein
VRDQPSMRSILSPVNSTICLSIAGHHHPC